MVQPFQVGKLVFPYNGDGHNFIRSSTKRLLSEHLEADVTEKRPRSTRNTARSRSNERKILTRPRTFAHYVLNLPASAITFLPSFIGLYAGQEHLFTPETETKLPLIHVYCFNSKDDDIEAVEGRICQEISDQLSFEVKPGDGGIEGQVSIWDVRDVSPHKRMFCASFRLPAKVAFEHP